MTDCCVTPARLLNSRAHYCRAWKMHARKKNVAYNRPIGWLLFISPFTFQLVLDSQWNREHLDPFDRFLDFHDMLWIHHLESASWDSIVLWNCATFGAIDFLYGKIYKIHPKIQSPIYVVAISIHLSFLGVYVIFNSIPHFLVPFWSCSQIMAVHRSF